MSSLTEAFKEGQDTRQAAESKVIRGLDKKRADFFVAVRARGLLNATLEGPAKAFEEEHPDMRCKWEYWPPNGDNTMVVQREALGLRVVNAEEVTATESSQKTGPVRRGDLVLMAGPREIMDLIAEEDARAAQDDYKLPEQTYREYVESLTVRLKDGTIQHGKAVGGIRKTEEVRSGVLEPDYELAE